MSTDDRHDLVARWYALTRETLPRMAPTHRWPVRLDHCFMRICLDAAIGAPWSAYIARPAIRGASVSQLAAAVAVAERVVRCPELLPILNAASLRGRLFPDRKAAG